MAVDKIEIKQHDFCYKNQKDANKCLQLADAFLEAHPEIIYWTERNNTKKGLFYRYNAGLYSAVSGLEVEHLLLEYKPKDGHILIPSLISQGRIQETINNIIRRRFFYREDFNKEGVINFRNGFFDIEDKQLIPHTQYIISTNQLPYEYDPEAKCPHFMKALKDATEDDPAKMVVIQEFAGYCLIKETRLEKILFLIGAAGSGKSTICDGITAMLGDDNVSSATMEKIGNPRYAGLFIDKIANISTEIPKDATCFEEALKNITSGEKITVDTKYLPSYDARPHCKMLFAGNDLPSIADTSNAIFRRMLLVYLNNVVTDEKMDTDLKHKVKQEGAGIFNWAMEGRQRLVENKKFTISPKMREDIEVVKLQNNSVYYFVTENYEVDCGHEDYVIYEDLYEHFKVFCHHVGARGIYKKTMFGKEIKKIFLDKVMYDQRWMGGTTKRVWRKMKKKDGVTYKSSQPIEWSE